ncbi:hypothetical protein [Gordonia sihwensis]|uniref:hypothetical protein n=1 Tax=Gordonia sihwensis TaxID=173559 RepID=UPI003D954171
MPTPDNMIPDNTIPVLCMTDGSKQLMSEALITLPRPESITRVETSAVLSYSADEITLFYRGREAESLAEFLERRRDTPDSWGATSVAGWCTPGTGL